MKLRGDEIMEQNYFLELNKINVNDKTEKKNGLTYLSWAWAWGEVKKLHADANYTIYENKDGWNYHTDGKTGWVKTGVTIKEIEHIEYLPIMDFRNKSITADNITSFDVNKAIQRSLTKAVARHGLGLYIYAGEDLPETETETKKQATKKPELATEKQIAELIDLVQDTDAVAAYFKKATIEDLTKVEIQSIINRKKAQNETPKV